MSTPPNFPNDFKIGEIGMVKYFTYQTEKYEITVEPQLWEKFSVALYINQGLQGSKITNLNTTASVQEAVNKLFLTIK